MTTPHRPLQRRMKSAFMKIDFFNRMKSAYTYMNILVFAEPGHMQLVF